MTDPWRTSLPAFAAHMSTLVGGERWLPYPHLVYLCQKITEELHRPEGGRLILNMPPRHGKSELCSRWLPTWYLEALPHHTAIITSYEAGHAEHWGRKVRDAFLSEHTWTSVRQDVQAAYRWETPQGGGCLTAGVGGPITGRGGNLIIIDDPHKNWAEANSPAKRRYLIDWFQSTAYTRAEPGATIIVIHTRWHKRDLTGWLLDEHKDKWTHISLPAKAEEGDPLGRSPGQPLFHERYTAEDLTAIETGLAVAIWQAMFQQHPTPPEGSIIKDHWIRHWSTLPPRFDRLLLSWDMAFKDLDTSSYVVGQVWGRSGANAYLLDQVRARMDFVATLHAMEALYSRWPDVKEQLVEDKANGTAVIRTMRDRIPGLIPINPQGSKESRCFGVSPLFASGNVLIPPIDYAPWVREYIGEVTTFPGAPNDDQVDGTTQALDRLFSKKTKIKGITIPIMSQENIWRS